MESKARWEGKHYAFFCNHDCECFPCHKNIPAEDFNCLFCYCPLYALGENCGGKFYYNEKGIKTCVNCDTPHRRENYGLMIQRFSQLIELTKKK